MFSEIVNLMFLFGSIHPLRWLSLEASRRTRLSLGKPQVVTMSFNTKTNGNFRI